MKKVLTIICIACMLATTAVAGTTIKCTVTEVITPILPEGNGAVLMECKDLEDIKAGDKVKVKVQKPKTAAIEGC